jgi:hypothetical protein
VVCWLVRCLNKNNIEKGYNISNIIIIKAILKCHNLGGGLSFLLVLVDPLCPRWVDFHFCEFWLTPSAQDEWIIISASFGWPPLSKMSGLTFLRVLVDPLCPRWVDYHFCEFWSTPSVQDEWIIISASFGWPPLSKMSRLSFLRVLVDPLCPRWVDYHFCKFWLTPSVQDGWIIISASFVSPQWRCLRAIRTFPALFGSWC